MSFVIMSVISNDAISVESKLRNPYLVLYYRLFMLKKSYGWKKIVSSNTFEMTGSDDIGL